MNKDKEKELINKYSYMFEEKEIGRKRMAQHAELDKQWRKDMSEEEKAEMKKKRNEIGSFQPIVFGFECDEGWYDLLDRLMAKIVELDVDKSLRVHQIKEKFGGLRFYTGGEIRLDIIGDASYAMDRNQSYDKIYEAIDEAEAESYRTCEVCGKPGRLCINDSRWLKTVCLEHRDYIDWQDIKRSYRPVCSFGKESKVIVNNERIDTVQSAEFDKTKDEWLYTMTDGTVHDRTTLSHIPCSRFYKGWFVKHQDYPKLEFVIVDVDFNPKDGYLYKITLPGSPDATTTVLESMIEAIRDENRIVKQLKDEE